MRFGFGSMEPFTSNDKLKQLFDDKYDILKRYRSEQFIGDCLERLVKSEIKVASIYNPFYGKLLRQPEVAAPYVFYYKGNARLFSANALL